VTLNPFVTGGDAPPTRDLIRPLMPALYRVGPKGVRQPWLLAREPSSADIGGTPWSVRLRLREDAVWSDGTAITANDLRFTWQAVMRSPSIASRDGYDRLADVVVESSSVARLVFRAPFARWRDLFGAGLGVLPAHALGKTDISKALVRAWPVSGGAFVLKTWTPGLEMVFEPNPRAWGSVPNLDRIRVQFVPDPVTALQLYGARKVDVLGPYASVDWARRAKAARDGTTTTADRGATWAGLFLNVRSPVLSDVRVRRALVGSIERPAIAEGLVRDQGAFTDVPSGSVAARTVGSFSRYGYAPRDAESTLQAAGWRESGRGARRKGGRELSITVAAVGSDELVQRVLRACNAQASAVGVDLNLVSMDADELWGAWIHGSKFQAALLVERDPPDGSLRARFGLPGAHDVSRLNDGGLRTLLDTSDGVLDPDASAVDAPFGRVADLVPVIPLFQLDVVLAARKGVNEVVASSAADGFLAHAEDWWIEGATPLPTAS
ncbi:MAG: ABC transporter substrate-binding protein, partial [Actinomycetota bacterium]